LCIMARTRTSICLNSTDNVQDSPRWPFAMTPPPSSLASHQSKVSRRKPQQDAQLME